jgi:WD40 repeat protein
VRNFLGHTYHINTLSLQNDILVSGGGDTKAIVWNILTGKRIFTAEHNSWVGSVGVTENHLVTSTGKGQINIWKYGDGIQILSITAHDGAIRTIAISSNQKFLFSGGKDSKIKIWSFPELNLINEFYYHKSEIRRLAADYSGTTIFSGDSKGNVFMFDVISQREKQILNLEGQMIRSITFSDKYRLLALAISTGEVVVWDAENEVVKWRVQGHNGQSIGIAFHPEKEIVATGGQDKTIRLWNLKNGAIIDSIVGHSNTITSLVFSQNGKWLLSSSRDEIISMWQVL